MLKRIVLMFLISFMLVPPAFAKSKKPKSAFWKRNRINLFYQKKDYKGLTDKYKDFSVGVMEVKDERMSKFYHKKDNFFQTKLIPTFQLFIKEELDHTGMFKEVKLIYEPYKGEVSPEMMDRIREIYNVDMIMLVNLTDFQMERSISRLHSQMLTQGGQVVNPASLDGMDVNFKVGGIFQLVFLPLHYVIWSDTVEREYLKFASTGRLKSKEEMEPIVQNLLSQVMTDMLYLISEDGKVIRVN